MKSYTNNLSFKVDIFIIQGSEFIQPETGRRLTLSFVSVHFLSALEKIKTRQNFSKLPEQQERDKELLRF